MTFLRERSIARDVCILDSLPHIFKFVSNGDGVIEINS